MSTETPAAAAAAGADGAAPSSVSNVAVLVGRELEWAKNSPELEASHQAANGAIVRTRFPPEPNGYLHIGHAKSMNMNFRLAFDKLGVAPEHRRTIFRYDDTNPDAESAEYIDSLERDLRWLGWSPERTTYSSDNFQRLYDFAVELIKKGLAYVCDMTADEIKAQRELALARVNDKYTGKDPDKEHPIPSPDVLPGRNRDTPVARNLKLFDQMKLGFFKEGQYTLRLKMDFESPNPNMYDLIAYRIKYTRHPHAGDGWCIYPAYDFTHGICDSLEDIDYSICTLEFESRREPYYWILWALDLYRPKVYEMSRLNVQGTVLSKRRLIKLVDTKRVRGWDDPRMPTISGLRRRGYSAKIINQFCMDVGATRAANVVEQNKLEQTARLLLAPTSRRVMACLQPVAVWITNWNDFVATKPELTFQVANSPTDESLGYHQVTLTEHLFLDSPDFRMVDSPEYFGLAPNKAVGLKYQGGNLVCDKVIFVDDNDQSKGIKQLQCRLDMAENRTKPQTFLSWVPDNGLRCEVRVYNPLFLVAEPTDAWWDELNPESEVVYDKAIIDPSAADVIDGTKVDKWISNTALQLERLGYFVVDYETKYSASSNPSGQIVLNRTVSLKEELAKKKLSQAEEQKLQERRERTKRDTEAKERRMQIDPKDLFRLGEEFAGKYSKYDDKGLPTHDVDGLELTKSAIKKLAKEQQKHIKQQAAWNKNKK